MSTKRGRVTAKNFIGVMHAMADDMKRAGQNIGDKDVFIPIPEAWLKTPFWRRAIARKESEMKDEPSDTCRKMTEREYKIEGLKIRLERAEQEVAQMEANVAIAKANCDAIRLDIEYAAHSEV